MKASSVIHRSLSTKVCIMPHPSVATERWSGTASAALPCAKVRDRNSAKVLRGRRAFLTLPWCDRALSCPSKHMPGRGGRGDLAEDADVC